MGSKWSRRQVLKGAAGAGAGLAMGGVSGTLLAAPAIKLGSDKLTYWAEKTFSERVNSVVSDAVDEWARSNGVQAEVVFLSPGEQTPKTISAAASNTLPDLIDILHQPLLLLSKRGIFLQVDDLFAKIGERNGGWVPSVVAGTDMSRAVGGRMGVPRSYQTQMLLRRKDALAEAGFTAPPETWDETVAQAAAAQQPPLYGLGIALAMTEDSFSIPFLQSFGGRLADDDGKRVVIKSAETRAYLDWVADAYRRDLFSPGAVTWDASGDNQAFLSGQSIFALNTGSIGRTAFTQDPELYESIGYSMVPRGPKLQVDPIQPSYRAIPASSPNADAAKSLIEHLTTESFLAAFHEGGYYPPSFQRQAQTAMFAGGDEILTSLAGIVHTTTAPGWPDVNNEAFAEAYNGFVVTRMVQAVLLGQASIDVAMDDAQVALEAIYAKY